MKDVNPKVEEFIIKSTQWNKEYELLRSIIHEFDLNETFKWGQPCYTYENNNVLIVHGFKNYCAILFVKGVLLKDYNNVLIQQTEYVQAARQIRFKNAREIQDLKEVIHDYISEAIEIEKTGLKVEFKKNEELVYPEEFALKIAEKPGLRKAFESLTPGRQRAYIYYFSGAKQEKTRLARIDKYIDKILSGKGLDD